MVDKVGFEPTTYRVSGGCSTGLSYSSIFCWPAWTRTKNLPINSRGIYQLMLQANNSEGILALRRPVPFRRQNGIRTHISFFAVRTGLEPVISAVTVRRPLQLDRQTNNLEDRTRIVYKAFSNFLFLLVGNMWSSTTPCICSVLTQQSTILSS